MSVEVITSYEELRKVLSGSRGLRYVLIDFYANWCGPCKRFSPTLEALSQHYTDVTFVKFDIDNDQSVCNDFNISSIPTFVLYDTHHCKKKHKIEGANETELVKVLNEYSKKFIRSNEF